MEGCGIVGLPSLEVYNSIFIIIEENKFELYTHLVDEFSLAELKVELDEILDFSNISDEHPHDKKIGPRVLNACRELSTEKSQTDG